MEEHFRTLMGKLRQLYTQGKEIGLSQEEAVIYGTEYADGWSMEELVNLVNRRIKMANLK